MKLTTLARLGLGSAAHAAMGSRTPLSVMVSVTDRCPGRCRYCDIPNNPAPEMSTAQLLRLMDQIAEAGAARVAFWGGEPLMRDDIADIAGRAADAGLYVTMDTNGLMLPERRAVLDRLHHVVIALDGDKEAHDANRGSGTQERVVQALELAVASGLPVWTISVLTRHNLDSVDYTLDLADRMGFLTTFQLLHHNEVLGRNMDEMIPSDEEYRRVVRHLVERKEVGAPIASSRGYLEHLLAWPTFSRPTMADPFGGVTCVAGRLYCNVSTSGELFPCSLKVGLGSGPSAVRLGFERAFGALQPPFDCRACDAGCFTEHNLAMNFDLGTVYERLRSLLKF